jgi:hypothetical protein
MKKPGRLVTKPMSVATTPQAMVRVGSQAWGVVLFRMMLHGIYEENVQIFFSSNDRRSISLRTHLKEDVADEVHGQASKVLISSL